MKIHRLKRNFKVLLASLAVAIGTGSYQSVNAQNYRDEIPEIGWNSRLTSMGLDKTDNIGKVYDFYCQPATEDLPHAPIWGTNVYTANSGICTTAVHAGAISSAGGVISIELLPGREFYTGSSKNGVTSKDRSGTDLSFTFVGEPVANNTNSQAQITSRRPSTIERVMVNSVQRGVERSIERAIIDLFD